MINHFPDIKPYLPSTPLPKPKLLTCAQCTAAPMTPQGLQLHQLQHHVADLLLVVKDGKLASEVVLAREPNAASIHNVEREDPVIEE